MKQYRKKPVVIEAMQWTGTNEQAIRDFVGNQMLQVSRPPTRFEHDHNLTDDMINIFIPTLEDEMRADRYDYIIKGIKGEFYPCKPDIFHSTYEPVETNKTPHMERG